ncbi:MAG TPA: GNAT family N-acetyltransferase [Polyangiaceae bacterium]|nr:GNAT family N-acetyltransferase [Polyangiaceae bacterium]
MDVSPPVSIPRLSTPRLQLREYRMEDFDAFAAHLADPEATAYLGVADRRTAWRIFGCQTGAWLLHGAGWWTVVRRDTGEVVGSVGAFFREGLSGIELGWNTYRAFWGRGFASEAAAEALRFAFEIRGEPHARALIDAGNAASIRVALRLGLRYDAEAELFGQPCSRYTIERTS